MSIYNETAICRICGYKTRVQIIAHGDYDGPDEPREVKDCPVCKAFKEVGIDIAKLTAYTREQLDKEKAAHEKTKDQLGVEKRKMLEVYEFFKASYEKQVKCEKFLERREKARQKEIRERLCK